MGEGVSVVKAYQPSLAYLHTREEHIKDFMNAETEYDKWKAFEAVLKWLDSKDELQYYTIQGRGNTNA